MGNIYGFFNIQGTYNRSALLKSIKDTAITTSVIFSIIAMATFLSKVFTYTQFPQFIIKSITDMGVGLNFFSVCYGINLLNFRYFY